MRHGQDDVWDAFVNAMLSIAPVVEGRSRYGEKPALSIAGREIAHREAADVIDLRITRAGWSKAHGSYGTDPAIRRDPSRRDWIELHVRTTADLERLSGLLAIAVTANA